MVAHDPSESVRSGEIERLVKACFDVTHEWNWGGTLNHLLFQNIAANFDPANASHRSIIELLIHHENVLIRDGLLPSDFKVFLARHAIAAEGRSMSHCTNRATVRDTDGRPRPMIPRCRDGRPGCSASCWTAHWPSPRISPPTGCDFKATAWRRFFPAPGRRCRSSSPDSSRRSSLAGAYAPRPRIDWLLRVDRRRRGRHGGGERPASASPSASRASRAARSSPTRMLLSIAALGWRGVVGPASAGAGARGAAAPARRSGRSRRGDDHARRGRRRASTATASC